MKLYIAILIEIFTISINAYRWTVIEDDVSDVCNKQQCGTRPHSVCLALNKGGLPTANCSAHHKFKWLPIGQRERSSIVDGHNGLRNRVARSHFLPVSDMNLLHWDKDLQRMAEGWIGQCYVNQLDECQFIYDASLSVGQNIMYIDEFRREDWEIKMVRSWYLQGNTIDVNVIKKYWEVKESMYTQLIWSKAQFVGCAAAQIGKGYVMACNYYPKGNIVGEPVNKLGGPCTSCDVDRASCSGIFKGLCGLDASSTRLSNGKYSWIFLLVASGLMLHLLAEG